MSPTSPISCAWFRVALQRARHVSTAGLVNCESSWALHIMQRKIRSEKAGVSEVTQFSNFDNGDQFLGGKQSLHEKSVVEVASFPFRGQNKMKN